MKNSIIEDYKRIERIISMIFYLEVFYLLQYEDLEKMESGSSVYFVHDENFIFELKLSGINNQKCMLIHPEFYRFDVYKDTPNRYKMFATEKEAISYTEEKNNLLRK